MLDIKSDVAMAHCDEKVMERYFPDNVPYLPLGISDENEGTTLAQNGRLEVFSLIGYPANHNYQESRSIKRSEIAIFADLAEKPWKDSEIECPIVFRYNHKRMVLVGEEHTTLPPAIHGLSGGPAVEFVSVLQDGNQLGVAHVAGVLAIWDAPRREVIAAAKDAIEPLAAFVLKRSKK